TDLLGENGLPVDRPLCEFVAGFDANNLQTREVDVPATGGFVTSACTRKQAGPLRDCGWEEGDDADLTCVPGEVVTMLCSTAGSAPQAVRVCEGSAERGLVTTCMFRDALATAIVGSELSAVSFTCPGAREPSEPGGSFGWFAASLLPDTPPEPITCEVN
ncbi:MAG TPA: hypothetical protein VEL05_00695, partial [Candidatus Acidoferrum sp.]|nr:hypothetical protein [Candidatus Acidoferrum sp.]